MVQENIRTPHWVITLCNKQYRDLAIHFSTEMDNDMIVATG